MIQSGFMHCWNALLGSLAVIVLILMAFGIMLRLVEPADAMKYSAASMGIVIVLAVAPGIMLSAWLVIPWWQKGALFLLGICIWQWQRPRGQSRRVKGER